MKLTILSSREKNQINPVDFHTQILDEEQAELFIRKAPATSSATAIAMLSYSIGYFDKLGYIPIPLIREILDTLPLEPR